MNRRLMLAALWLTVTTSGFAAKPAPPPSTPLDPLPLEAQVLLDKGVDAAKAGDIAKAMELFEQADYKAPDSAAIFLNRGLAESKVPGREYRAIAWLGAYLDSNPSASNATAVKEAIRDAQKRADATRVVLAKGFVGAATATGASYQIEKANGYLVRAQLAAGDIAGADATLNVMKDASTQAVLRLMLAEAKVTAGDAAGARALVSIVEKAGETGNYSEFNTALSAVAVAQAKAGDRAGVAQSLALLKLQPARYTNDFDGRSQAHAQVARAQFAAGDKEGANASVRETLIDAQKANSLKIYRIVDGGELQAELGDLEGARATSAALKGDDYHQAQVLVAVAREQAKHGDTAGALATAAQTADFMRANALNAVADEQIKAGQVSAGLSTLADALKTSLTMKFPLDRTLTQTSIAFYQIQARDIAAARATLKIAALSQKKIPFNTARGFSSAGSDQRMGGEAVSSTYAEIEWQERPWTRWTHHLSAALNTAPFPDVVTSVRNGAKSYSDPNEYLSAVATALDALPKERALIEKLLAGGPPY